MADAAILHRAVVTRLELTPWWTVYEGNVPETPPSDDYGYVLPYVVVWPGAGLRPVGARELHGLTTGNELDWAVQITVVGGDVDRCLSAAGGVRAALYGWAPAPGTSRLDEQQPSATEIRVDSDVTPPRLYLPLRFACTTT